MRVRNILLVIAYGMVMPGCVVANSTGNPDEATIESADAPSPTRHEYAEYSTSFPGDSDSDEVSSVEEDYDPVAVTDLKLIPYPVSVIGGNGAFEITSDTRILVGYGEAGPIGDYLAARLNAATGFDLEVAVDDTSSGDIVLAVAETELGSEGYELSVSPEGILLVASDPDGLFWGVQTLRQLLPPQIESVRVEAERWLVPSVEIKDRPRFEYRGAMLDVARHFFGVEEVKRYIDLMAYYKLNVLHLHLTDDQGWRIEIDAWPNLTGTGASSAVGGDLGGFYTQSDLRQIVAYALSRHITVIPEVEMPGHSGAALSSYPELNCNGIARPLQTGMETGRSSLCISKETTYQFVEDVITEIAALTPGPFFHIGGDEVTVIKGSEYVDFVSRVEQIVAAAGKRMIGWEEISKVPLSQPSIVQYWRSAATAKEAAKKGFRIIASPSTHAYLDMKYDSATVLGLNWAGTTNVEDSYSWDPTTLLPEVNESAFLGVEAPLWTETLRTFVDVEFMAFPRLAAIAEIGWTPREARVWTDFRRRLAGQAPRWQYWGLNYFVSPEIDWE